MPRIPQLNADGTPTRPATRMSVLEVLSIVLVIVSTYSGVVCRVAYCELSSTPVPVVHSS